jgi:hypothetical protein
MLPAARGIDQKTSSRRRIWGMLADPAKHDFPAPVLKLMIVSRYLDRRAITLSTICIVHCLAMPLVIAVLPIAAVTIGSDGHFHALMLWLVVPTSVVGFALGYRVHAKAGIVLSGAVAVVLLAVIALWGHSAWSATTEVVGNVLASLLLASAHWRNFREVRRIHRHA